MSIPALTVYADKDCKACHGEGVVRDWVPYGSTNVSMPSDCDCVTTELTDEDWDAIENGRLEFIVEPAPEFMSEYQEVGNDD